MIQIYAPGNTNFEKNGDVALQPSVCDLDMTLNGAWELEIEVPADELGKFRAVTTGAVIAVPTPWSDKQLFRIYDHDTSDSGSVGLARPIFLDAENEVFVMDKRPTNCVGQEALDTILRGTKYAGRSNIKKLATAYYVRKNAIQAIASDEENSFINRWGGEIAYDNFTVTINERMGEDRGLRVEFGRNVQSIHDHGNSEELATRLYPVAFNGRLISGEKQYVDSERIGDYPIVYSKILKCEDIKLREDLEFEPEDGDIVCENQEELDAALRQRCADNFAAGVDVLETAYDVDMDDLSTKDEYEKYRNLERVELGDTVHCRHKRLNISADARVVQLIWDCTRKKNKKLYIGDYKKDYFARQNDAAQRVQELHDELVNSENNLNKAIKDASERLDKALKEASGLYCTTIDDGKGGTIILLHDKKTLEESSNVIKLTADAIGFSTDGGKSYPYGFTIDGEFVARLLSVYGINADWITSGVLQSVPDESGQRNFVFDLNTGEMTVQDLSIHGKTPEEIAEGEASEALKEFAEGDFADTVKELREQMDQKAESWLQAEDPSSEWTTPEEKANHKGDMWRVPGESGAKQWTGTAWEDMKVDPPDAVFDAIDGKAQIWAKQPTPPYHENDLWFGGTESEIKICTTTREDGEFVPDDWIKYDYYISLQKAKDEAKDAVDAQTQEFIFDKLTNGGKDQGIYLKDGMLYVNASYIQSGTISLELLKLIGTACGLMQGYGQTLSGRGTVGIVIYGNGVDGSGDAKPPYIIVTNAGIRGQASSFGAFSMVGTSQGGFFDCIGDLHVLKEPPTDSGGGGGSGISNGNLYVDGAVRFGDYLYGLNKKFSSTTMYVARVTDDGLLWFGHSSSSGRGVYLQGKPLYINEAGLTTYIRGILDLSEASVTGLTLEDIYIDGIKALGYSASTGNLAVGPASGANVVIQGDRAYLGTTGTVKSMISGTTIQIGAPSLTTDVYVNGKLWAYNDEDVSGSLNVRGETRLNGDTLIKSSEGFLWNLSQGTWKMVQGADGSNVWAWVRTIGVG